jgi:hypothetical protein
MISNITQKNPFDSFFVNRKSKTEEEPPVFSILSEEVGFMLERTEESESPEYASIFSMEADRKAQQVKSKLEAESNPFKDQNLPDTIFNKIKELFPDDGSREFIHTERALFGLMLTGNAISQSGGLDEKKIDLENVDWQKVIKKTLEDFEKQLQPDHIEEIGKHFREEMDDPRSPFYFYSAEDKTKRLEQYLQNNYELNKRMVDAAQIMLNEMQG